MKDIHLLGLFRVGTNYVRTLIELNYDGNVIYNALGWKHGLLPTFNSDSSWDYENAYPLVIVKNPHATLDSWFQYSTKNGKNLRVANSDIREFLRSPITFWDEQSEITPQYHFSSPTEMWNSVTWNHVSFADSAGGLVVRYEDILADPEAECRRIADHYQLTRTSTEFINPENVTRNLTDQTKVRESDESNYLTRKRFSKKEYILEREYLKRFSREDISLIREGLTESLLSRLDYSPVGYSPREDTADYVIYTMAGSTRLDDLTVLLQSNREYDAAPVRVIPFDDVSPEMERICSAYGATIVTPDEKWDALGRTMFGDGSYRPNAESWRFFRKFNALDHSSSPFVFIDANCVIVNSLSPAINMLTHFDVVFGSRSQSRRNFTPWAKNILGHISPNIGEGFSAAFWAVRAGAVSAEEIESLGNFPRTRAMLTVAPEQSVLSLGLALQRAKVGLLVEADPTIANAVAAARVKRDQFHFGEDGSTFRGRTALVVKWSGTQESRNENRPMGDVYSHFWDRAVKFLDRHSAPQ